MPSDLADWERDEPPPGFAERVVQAVRAEDARRARARSRRIKGAVAVVVAVAAAAAALVAFPRTPRGEAEAIARREVTLGPRAIAVLEPGARIAWAGDVVTQAQGAVFYRVESGAPFRVHTNAGDVTVKGTCFRVTLKESQMQGRDVKIAAASAALGAAALVGVYEGKVALSHPSGASVDVSAGESAVADGRGVRKGGDKALGEHQAEGDDPLVVANASLADNVRAYKGRLEAIQEEKKKLEKDLAEAQAKLAASMDGATLAGGKLSQYDLSDDDWKQLAQQGSAKARWPCDRPSDWDYSPKALNKLGLRPDDNKPIAAAFGASQKRRWAVIRPLCAQALAGAADVADKVGEAACVAIIQTMAGQKDSQAADEGVRMAAEVRAGLRPMPGPDDAINPVERLMLTLSGETKVIEADLTKSLGPDDARRVVFAEEGCWHNGSWSVGPRGADTP